MKKILFRHWQLLSVIILSIVTVLPLFKNGYFPHHDDLQIIRIFEMRRCLADLQIPCRWVPDMGYGFGYPLFNYYSVFPYYLGAIVSYFTSYISTAKFLFMLSQVLGGVGMFILAKRLFDKNAALVSAVLYTFAPYKAVDIYVRGAMSESFALGLVPFIFYFLFKIDKDNGYKNYAGLSIIFFLFLLTHNISTLLFSPVFILVLVYIYVSNGRKDFFKTSSFLLLGLGMAAFFILPAFFEKNLVQTESLTRFELNFRSHFVSLQQFVSTKWGYGPSVLGPNDSLSFQIGWPLLILAVLPFFILVTKRPFSKNLPFLRDNNIPIKIFLIIITSTILFVASVFMAHYRSAFIWELFDILAYVQFPWRFLGIAAFFGSITGGAFVYLIKERRHDFVAAIIVVFTVTFNFIYFRPVHMYQITDEQKFQGAHWRAQQMGAILDYLPKTAIEPREKAPSMPVVVSGAAEINNYTKNSDNFEFSADIMEDAVVMVPIYYFPKWKVDIDEEYTHPTYDRFGRILIEITRGDHIVKGKLFNTPIRSLSNIISGISMVVILGYLINEKYKKLKI